MTHLIDDIVNATIVRLLEPTPLNPDDSIIGAGICLLSVAVLYLGSALIAAGLLSLVIIGPVLALSWLGFVAVAKWLAVALVCGAVLLVACGAWGLE